MRVRLLFTVLALTATPGLALAMCSGERHEQANMSCPEGQTLDVSTQTCKAPATG